MIGDTLKNQITINYKIKNYDIQTIHIINLGDLIRCN